MSSGSHTKGVGELVATCACTSTPLIRSGRVVCASCGAPILGGSGSPRLLSQYPGETAEGCSGELHLKIFRKAWNAGDPGATKRGRARLMTRECFDRFAASEKPTTKPTPVPLADPDERALKLLGLSARRSA